MGPPGRCLIDAHAALPLFPHDVPLQSRHLSSRFTDTHVLSNLFGRSSHPKAQAQAQARAKSGREMEIKRRELHSPISERRDSEGDSRFGGVPRPSFLFSCVLELTMIVWHRRPRDPRDAILIAGQPSLR